MELGDVASERRGASLPIVIIFMALLALAVTVGMVRISDERRIVSDQQANLDAYAVAQSGIELYVAQLDTAPGIADSKAIPIGQGDTAFIVVSRVRDAAGNRPALYLIVSRGVSLSSRKFDQTTPPSQRTVAQLAELEGGQASIPAAWTALAGLRSEGNQGFISGFDECAGGTDVAGIAVPDSLHNALWYPADQRGFGLPAEPEPQGNPPILYLGGIGSYPEDARDFINIAWDSIVNGSLLYPDLTSGGPWTAQPPWSVIRVDGSVSVGPLQSGSGLIVVTDSLELTGGFVWDGLILVGRQLAITGNTPFPARVRGAMVSGLDVKLPSQSPPFFRESNTGTTADDRIDIQYNSCNVRDALARYARLTLIPNAWMDTWPQN